MSPSGLTKRISELSDAEIDELIASPSGPRHKAALAYGVKNLREVARRLRKGLKCISSGHSLGCPNDAAEPGCDCRNCEEARIFDKEERLWSGENN